jgi:hypothetical protein
MAAGAQASAAAGVAAGVALVAGAGVAPPPAAGVPAAEGADAAVVSPPPPPPPQALSQSAASATEIRMVFCSTVFMRVPWLGWASMHQLRSQHPVESRPRPSELATAHCTHGWPLACARPWTGRNGRRDARRRTQRDGRRGVAGDEHVSERRLPLRLRASLARSAARKAGGAVAEGAWKSAIGYAGRARPHDGGAGLRSRSTAASAEGVIRRAHCPPPCRHRTQHPRRGRGDRRCAAVRHLALVQPEQRRRRPGARLVADLGAVRLADQRHPARVHRRHLGLRRFGPGRSLSGQPHLRDLCAARRRPERAVRPAGRHLGKASCCARWSACAWPASTRWA